MLCSIAPLSSHIYLLFFFLILRHLLRFVFCVHRCQGWFKNLLFIICVSPITGIILDWCWAGEWGTCHLPTRYTKRVTNSMFTYHLTEHVMMLGNLTLLGFSLKNTMPEPRNLGWIHKGHLYSFNNMIWRLKRLEEIVHKLRLEMVWPCSKIENNNAPYKALDTRI